MGQVPQDAWFRERAEAFGDVFFVVRMQPDVEIEFIGENVTQQAGIPPEAFYANATLLGVDDGTLMTMRPGDRRTAEYEWVHPNGTPRWTQVAALCVEREDGSLALEGVARDITDLRKVQSALRDSEERHRLLVENAWDVIWTMALDGTITYVSPSVERVRGITPEEAAQQTLEQIHPPESRERVLAYYQGLFAAIAAGEELPVFRGEQEYYRKDGSIMVGELQVIPHVDREGRVVQILGVTRDVSERKQWEADLARLAVTDSLTGAYNRRHGEELMTALLEGDAQVSLLMIDLDHFKRINDAQGHRAGDEALIGFSKRLRAALYAADIFARWGGEEFVVMMRCPPEVAVTRAEAIRSAVAEWGEVTVSIGVASGTGASLDTLLRASDRALYQAKSEGRNRVVASTEPPPPQSPA